MRDVPKTWVDELSADKRREWREAVALSRNYEKETVFVFLLNILSRAVMVVRVLHGRVLSVTIEEERIRNGAIRCERIGEGV